ncbi:MAG: alpha/beta fold hydrolase [Corynebacterium sp.]|uniref:alpha/beta fold hydrolase n=1 Tax=Corynebacterium sp. TaxID=1720 RepID=UPI003F96A696
MAQQRIGDFTGDRARATYRQAYARLAERWPVEAEELTVDTSYGPTHVRRSGSGTKTPLVLMHGLNGSGLSWHSTVGELARDRVVYAPDVIGTAGKSRQTAPMESGDDYAAWGAELLEGIGHERVHLFGYSEGSWFSALTAGRAVDRVASVTLGEGITTFVPASKKVVRKMITTAMWPTRRNFARLDEWLTPGAELTAEDKDLAKAAMKYRRRSPWPSPLSDTQLRAITAPVLAIFGEQTRLGDPHAAAARINDLIPRATVEMVPDGGHSVLWQYPGVVLPMIGGFIDREDG